MLEEHFRKMTEYVSLKPNRDLLNAKFESYHLGPTTLETERKILLQPVAYYPLKDDHYSFSHLRAHAEQNLLVLDSWNKSEDVLYFVDESFAVMGLCYDKTNGSFGSPFTMCKFAEPQKDKIKEHISPSIAFPSPDFCMINDGAGKLYLCRTGERGGNLEKQKWETDVMLLIKDFGEPFYLKQCCQREDDFYCLLMSLEDEKKSASGHPRIFLHLLELIQNSKGSNTAGERFVVKRLKTLSGISAPLYASYTPDFSSVIIASQKVFSSEIKETEEKDDSTNGVTQSASEKDEKPEQVVVTDSDSTCPRFTNDQIEECDMENEEDMKFYVVNKEDDSIKLQTPLAGHQWIFNRIFNPKEPPSFCIRHDVDGLLWRPIQSETASNVAWEHVTTFNALGYVHASKKNHKYTICGAENGFVAIVDCACNIYVYMSAGISSKDGHQYVLELPTSDEILGVQASTTTLFLLTQTSLFAVKVL